MSKQDRQGVRTPADVERKYNLGQLAAAQGMTVEQEMALNQVNQTLSQFMADTNAEIDALKERDDLQEAVNEALAQAKESGEFDGEKGDPFTYEDFTEEQLASLKGDSYVLTDADKAEIAQMVSGGGLVPGGKVLWQGVDLMADGNASITLSEAISQQPNGIVLVFSFYNNNEGQNAAFQHFFVSKKFVELGGSAGGGKGVGNNFFLHANGFLYIGTKYLYISDTKITGYDQNDDVAADFNVIGVKYSNNQFCLRYVIGV